MKFFVFDVESIGLHGDAFAVAGGLYVPTYGTLQPEWEFRSAIPRDRAVGDESDRKWVDENVPEITETHSYALAMRMDFWTRWLEAKSRGAVMAAECLWPVEGRFVNACINDQPEARKWDGPYPFYEIAAIMLSAGMDPMATYDREESEKPAHEPLADVRQSVRLLSTALKKLGKL